MFTLILCAALAAVAVSQDIRFQKIDGTCGAGPVQSKTNFVVGGETVNPPFSYPFICSLRSSNTAGRHFCGGSLITNRNDEFFLVTAAHCVSNTGRYGIICGAHAVSATANEATRQTFNSARVTRHPNYNSNNYRNDIAIIALDRQPTPTAAVSAVCLPNSNYYAGETSTVLGWGTLSSGGSSPSHLQVAQKPIVSDSSCASSYNSFHAASMMCAGFPNGGVDACQGDSGGPLVAYRNNQWDLVGATSWGYGCAAAGYPGVYADVLNLKSFIDQQING